MKIATVAARWLKSKSKKKGPKARKKNQKEEPERRIRQVEINLRTSCMVLRNRCAKWLVR